MEVCSHVVFLGVALFSSIMRVQTAALADVGSHKSVAELRGNGSLISMFEIPGKGLKDVHVDIWSLDTETLSLRTLQPSHHCNSTAGFEALTRRLNDGKQVSKDPEDFIKQRSVYPP